MMPTLEPGRVA